MFGTLDLRLARLVKAGELRFDGTLYYLALLANCFRLGVPCALSGKYWASDRKNPNRAEKFERS
jgi:hypothetical protein